MSDNIYTGIRTFALVVVNPHKYVGLSGEIRMSQERGRSKSPGRGQRWNPVIGAGIHERHIV